MKRYIFSILVQPSPAARHEFCTALGDTFAGAARAVENSGLVIYSQREAVDTEFFTTQSHADLKARLSAEAIFNA